MQEAHHILDHIVGYRVSPVLSSTTGQKVGAGHVQSSAVRLVADPECTTAAFRSTQHYGTELVFTNEDATSWRAQFNTKPHLTPGETYLFDDKLAKLAAAIRDVAAAKYSDSGGSEALKAPFTTSTLQQAAGQCLKLKPKETMNTTQSLCDQGFITYLRAGSSNIDDEGVANIAVYVQSADLPLAGKQWKWKAKDGAQEDHEAVRPMHAKNLDCGVDAAEKALCRPTQQRTVASQLADAIYAVRTMYLAGDTEGTLVPFKTTGKTLVSPGWQAVYAKDAPDKDTKKGETSSSSIPALVVGDALVAGDDRLLIKKTKPPVRFKLSTLVIEMEKLGTSHPSAYAAILDSIIICGHITEDEGGYLLSSSTGEILRDGLVGRLKFIEFDYTRGLGDQFDQIVEEQATYLDVVSSAQVSLNTKLATLELAALPVAHPCPTCAKVLRRIKGESGFFWACSSRECKTTLPNAGDKPGERGAPLAPTGITCPKCGKELAHRVGTSKPIKRGMKPRPHDFYSCTGFPKCDVKYNMGADGKPVFGDDAPAAQEAS